MIRTSGELTVKDKVTGAKIGKSELERLWWGWQKDSGSLGIRRFKWFCVVSKTVHSCRCYCPAVFCDCLSMAPVHVKI